MNDLPLFETSAAVGPARRSALTPGFGGAIWPVGANEVHIGPRFDVEVPPGGYAWWYCDALSDDGRYGLTIIAFIGSVFSPYYAWAGRRDPQNHCALNVALYGRDTARSWTKGRWAMTERGREALGVSQDRLTIGPSSLHWDGSELVIDIDERAAPVPLPVKGRVRVVPEAVTRQIFALDSEGHHRWWPIAPTARVEVSLTSPDLSWSGHGYFDTNDGEIALESTFANWDWSRAALSDGSAVLYDVLCRDGARRALALKFERDGSVSPFEPAERVRLPDTIWRMPRHTHADHGAARVVRTMEDSPFYARSELETHVLGERVQAVHESLSLDRFMETWVKLLLPFRMPRAA